MRFDIPVYFVKYDTGQYDPQTGNYETKKPIETRRDANVSSSGAETLNLIYGELRQGSCVVRLQNHYDTPFDRIRIGQKMYKVDFSRKLRTKHVFVVSEVP